MATESERDPNAVICRTCGAYKGSLRGRLFVVTPNCSHAVGEILPGEHSSVAEPAEGGKATERDEAEAVAAIVDGIEMPDWHVVANQRGRFRMELRMAVEAAREPLLKRIEDLELAVAAARSRAKTAEESIEELKRRSSSAVFFEDQLVRTQAELSVTETERSKLGQRVADLEKSLVEAGNHWRCDNALADAKAEGRREAIEEVRRMIRRWEMAREQAGASEIRNVYADYLSAGDVILAAIDALAKEGR